MHRITTQSITDLLSDYRGKSYSITRASLVIGSQVNPPSIANPHIRSHALEGKLFRSAVEQALKVHGTRTFILLARDAYDKAATGLKKPSVDVRRTIRNIGRFTDGPWRAEQQFAALAAWFSLARRFASGASNQQ